MIVVDDDDLSRELLVLIAVEAGFDVQSFASGDETLRFAEAGSSADVILTDMQMPGICGDDLAQRLRSLCGEKTRLIAMSGSPVAPSQTKHFDSFLLKPFSADELRAACNQTPVPLSAVSQPEDLILDEAVYANFSASMPAEKVAALYQMCVDDAGRRLEKMRGAIAARDDAEYRRCAHAIKGSCGMVGALELARLAAAMEISGLPLEHDLTPLDQFLTASKRLERILNIKVNRTEALSSDVRA